MELFFQEKKCQITLTNDSGIAFMRDNRNQILKFDRLFYGVWCIYYPDCINIQYHGAALRLVMVFE